MACHVREKRGTCSHYQCEFSDRTDHGYECVEVDHHTKLCEVGEGCLPECSYSFTEKDVQTCPDCKGALQEEGSCPTCGIFGIVRIEDAK